VLLQAPLFLHRRERGQGSRSLGLKGPREGEKAEAAGGEGWLAPCRQLAQGQRMVSMTDGRVEGAEASTERGAGARDVRSQ